MKKWSLLYAELELPAMKLNPELQETAVLADVNEQATGSTKIKSHDPVRPSTMY